MRKSALVRVLLSAVIAIIAGCSTPAERLPQTPVEAPTKPPSPPAVQPTIHTYKPQVEFDGPVLADNRLFWLGWLKERPNDRAIYMLDLATNKEALVVAPSPGHAMGYPDVTGDWLVMGEFTPETHSAWRLLAKDLRTQEEPRVLGGDESEEIAGIAGYAADSGRVVWLEADPQEPQKGRMLLQLHDLAANQTRTLLAVQPPDFVGSLGLSGDRVIYSIFHIPSDANQPDLPHYTSDVYLYEIGPDRSRALTTSHDAWQAAIHGNYVVWKAAAGHGQYGDISLLALDTGVVRTITHDGAKKGITYPTIGEGFVTWRENLAKDHVLLYLIETGETREIASDNAFAPLSHGQHLIWIWHLTPEDRHIRWIEPAEFGH